MSPRDSKAIAQALQRQMKVQQTVAPPPRYKAITELEKYRDLTSNNPTLTADFRPLNFDKLLSSGALRVTHRGMDTGFDPNPKGGFSIVSAYNDASGEQTRNWRDNPEMYGVAKEMFTARPKDIGTHKYLQIIQSAKDLGLTDDDIYLR